jgi:hypothetical protein
MSKYDLLRTIIERSKVLSNFYEGDPTDGELDGLNDIIKKDMDNLELKDIVFRNLNKDNMVDYWNFIFKYDFKDIREIKRKICKYVRMNKITLEMGEKFFSNRALMCGTCINQHELCGTMHIATERGHLGCVEYFDEKWENRKKCFMIRCHSKNRFSGAFSVWNVMVDTILFL